MSQPLIIMSAPNGARRQKKDHPNIPITPDEMGKCAEEIVEAGASILHLHVRDRNGAHSLDVGLYRNSIKAVRKTVGDKLIIQATTEAVGIYSRHQQMEMVRQLKPEAVSLALRELCPDKTTETEFAEFVKWVRKERIFPQYILYDEKDFKRFDEYRQSGLLNDDYPFTLLVFGSYTGQVDQEKIDALKHCSTQAEFPWAVCGFKQNEKTCVLHAAKNGGHIRVGFENNIWKNEDELLRNNAEMICFAHDAANTVNRTVASAQTVRNIFNLRN